MCPIHVIKKLFEDSKYLEPNLSALSSTAATPLNVEWSKRWNIVNVHRLQDIYVAGCMCWVFTDYYLSTETRKLFRDVSTLERFTDRMKLEFGTMKDLKGHPSFQKIKRG